MSVLYCISRRFHPESGNNSKALYLKSFFDYCCNYSVPQLHYRAAEIYPCSFYPAPPHPTPQVPPVILSFSSTSLMPSFATFFTSSSTTPPASPSFKQPSPTPPICAFGTIPTPICALGTYPHSRIFALVLCPHLPNCPLGTFPHILGWVGWTQLLTFLLLMKPIARTLSGMKRVGWVERGPLCVKPVGGVERGPSYVIWLVPV
jgi:hypothetical protein